MAINHAPAQSWSYYLSGMIADRRAKLPRVGTLLETFAKKPPANRLQRRRAESQAKAKAKP
jgi:hypothetical protein